MTSFADFDDYVDRRQAEGDTTEVPITLPEENRNEHTYAAIARLNRVRTLMADALMELHDLGKIPEGTVASKIMPELVKLSNWGGRIETGAGIDLKSVPKSFGTAMEEADQ